MQFTEEQIKNQEEFIKVLRYKYEASYLALLEATRTADEDAIRLEEAEALHGNMRGLTRGRK